MADELDRQWADKGVRVYYDVADLYYLSQERVGKYLIERGLLAGGHAGITDTSELMFVDRNGKWIRPDKLAPGNDATGVDGDPRQASVEFGRTFIAYKIDSAVTQIRSMVSADK